MLKSEMKRKKKEAILMNQKLEELMGEIETRTGIQSQEDMNDIIFLMKSEASQTFNTNIMRIALNMQEEKIASLIIAYYDCKLDDEMVLRAVKTQ